MTTINLANPQHLDALRWAAKRLTAPGLGDHARQMAAAPAPDEEAWKPKHAALATLADPARAAELVRGLLEQKGVTHLDVGTFSDSEPGGYRLTGIVFAERDADGYAYAEPVATWPLADIPRLVLAILDATTLEHGDSVRAICLIEDGPDIIIQPGEIGMVLEPVRHKDDWPTVRFPSGTTIVFAHEVELVPESTPGAGSA